MIYVSYGVTKSASTFVYQLTEEILRVSGLAPVALSAKVKGRNSAENYIDPITGAALDLVRDEVGTGNVVIKTHGAPDAQVLEAVSGGDVLASAVIRDPREIALSLIDHGRRSLRTGFSDFTEFEQPIQCLNTLKDQLKRFDVWASNERVLLLNYNEVCFNTEATISRIARQIEISVDNNAIVRKFQNKGIIGQFNKGMRDRFHELSARDNTVFFEAFPHLYEMGKFIPPG